MSEPRLVLIETAASLPGLLPPPAYEALQRAVVVLAREPDRHPAVPYLHVAGYEVQPAELAAAQPARGMNLMAAGGSSTEVRLAKGLLESAQAAQGDVAYLLGPGDEGLSRTVGIEAAKEAAVEVEFVFLMGAPRGLELLRLVDVMAKLRDPDSGCPWDLEQDHQSLARHLMEETFEALDAIDRGDDRDIVEELGDVLLQVMFHAQIAHDRNAFGIDEVARGIADKLVRRHPHVFGDATATTPDEVKANWDQLKAAEKPERSGPFDGVPMAMPALMLAEELQRKAAKHGFDWTDAAEPAAKVREELDEVMAAAGDADRDAEVGDLLLAAVALARRLDVEPEAALRRAAGRFRDRFEAVLRRAEARGSSAATLTAEEWLTLWAEAKDAGF